MKALRTTVTAAALALLVGTTFVPAPAHAQPGGCTQTSSGSQSNASTNRGARQNSAAVLPAVIAAAVQNVAVDALNGSLDNINASNISVVCLNDTLNQNDIRVLQDILNGSPILSQNRDFLNNTLRDATFLNQVTLVDNVNILAINLATGEVFVAR